MVHIRQPFFSIVSATIFMLLGLLYGVSNVNGDPISIGVVKFVPPVSWAVTGIMFLMAYFSLVHMKK